MTTLGSSEVLMHTTLIPIAGAVRADVVLESGETAPTGTQVLTIGSLVLTLGVLRSDFDSVGRPHAILIGGLGWQNLITAPISFDSPAGVRLTTVLASLARAAGTNIALPAEKVIGEHYAVEASRTGKPLRYMDALNDLVRAGYVASWRVDPDGITRFGARTPAPVTGRATAMRSDTASGITTYGLDDPAEFLPGNTIDGVPIGRVVIREAHGKLEADIQTIAPGKRAPSIRELIHRLAERGAVLSIYSVVTANGDGTLDLAPQGSNEPELKKVQQWTIGGVKFTPAPGEEVLVLRDDARTRPLAIGFKLDSGPFPGAARIGDTVRVLLPPAVFTGVIGGAPASGVLTFTTGYTLGNIETGSVKVGIE